MKLQKLALITLLFLLFSCKKDVPGPVIDEDCRYKFGTTLDDIYGAWEPAKIINLEKGDTLNYAEGQGHTGFIFGAYYADAFELRPDSNMCIYYVRGGRHCKERVDGTWYAAKDTIFISIASDIKLPVIALTKTELVVEDVVNFNRSKAVYRRNIK